MPNGLDWWTYTSWIESLLGGVVTYLRQVFLYLFYLIKDVFVFLYSNLVEVVLWLVRQFKRLAQWARIVWEEGIKRGLLKLVELYLWLREKLEAILGPVLRVLRRIRELYDEWFNRIFGPILNLIQRLRQLLVVFRIFNVRWARRLDARLLRIESKIAESYLTIRRQLNLIASYVNMLMDPLGLIRQNVLVESILRAGDALLKAITGKGLAFWVERRPGARAGRGGPFDPVVIARELEEAIEHDTGYFAAVGREFDKDAWIWLG